MEYFSSESDITYVIELERKRALARRAFKQARRTFRQNFVSTINRQTPSKFVWDRTQKISGNDRSLTILLIRINSTVCKTLEDRANVLGEHFHRVSSSNHYTRDFHKIKIGAEKHKINISGCTNKPYNRPLI